jgi:hypothetical protein
MYVLAELFLCALLVVAISTTLFLISLTVVGLTKGVLALAGLLRDAAFGVAINVTDLIRTYRSGIRVWASGRRTRGLVLRPVREPGMQAAPRE